MVSKSSIAGLLLALVVASLAVVATGPAAAADVTVTNETVAIDDNTQSVYAEVNNTGSVAANYTVEFTGLDADGNQTFTESRSLSTSSNTTDLVERTQLNATTTDEVRVMVTLDNTTVSESEFSASTGTIQKVAVGSGGWFDSSGNQGLVAFAAVAVGVVILGRRRD